VRISVVTPSFQQALYLPETLASVRAAAEAAPEHEVEHWVIDAGSTDGTRDILRGQHFAQWISEPDQGQSDAVNKGWARSTGEVLCFLCSDDLWETDTVRLIAEAFLKHAEVDLVYGDYAFLEGDSGWRRPKLAGAFSVERLFVHNFLSQPATFMRRQVYEQFGGLDMTLRYCMDHEYWLRIARDTRWHYIESPLAVMRMHGDAKTTAKLAEAWEETAKMADRYGIGPAFRRKAIWMRFLGQPLFRLRRRIYGMFGKMQKRRNP